MINDVWALRREGSLEAAASTGLLICLMHMQGSPDSMQNNPQYKSVVDEVFYFLQERVELAEQASISKQQLLIDPGFGFGKTLQQNLQLLHSLELFKSLGLPLLVGLSRKSMIGLILDKPVDQRLFGSVSTAVISAMSGADIIRVHDVTETKDAVAIVQAMKLAYNN